MFSFSLGCMVFGTLLIVISLTGFTYLREKQKKLEATADGMYRRVMELTVRDSVYLIAMLSADGKRYRVWGYYFDRGIAHKCIVENQSDLSEHGYYDFGILSKVGEGPLSVAEDQQWYKFRHVNGVLQDVTEIPTPPEFESVHFCF